MKPTCRIVQSLAPTRDVSPFSARLDRHVGTCLTCQAELARYGRLRRQLASLAEVVSAAPEPLAVSIATAISSDGEPHEPEKGFAHPARVAAAAGAVVATAAGAVAVAVWRHSRLAVR
jgi:anti-sigma factor RsiW